MRDTKMLRPCSKILLMGMLLLVSSGALARPNEELNEKIDQWPPARADTTAATTTMIPTTSTTLEPTTSTTLEPTTTTLPPTTTTTLDPTTTTTLEPTTTTLEPTTTTLEPTTTTLEPTTTTLEPTTTTTLEFTTTTLPPTTTTTLPPTTTTTALPPTTTTTTSTEAEALEAINLMSEELQPLFVIKQQTAWLEATDHTEEHANASNEAAASYSQAYEKQWSEVIAAYDYTTFEDPELRRRFELQAKPGTTILSMEDQQQLNADLSEMNSFSLLKVCPYEDRDSCDQETEGYSIDQLEVVLATLRDEEALSYYWEQWRDIAGKPTKSAFVDYVKLMNKAATNDANDFNDAGAMWLQPYTAPDYTSDDFKTDVDLLWENMKGLYSKLHAYVRYRLRNSDEYHDSFGDHSPIPAHLLGNMWAQSWENIYDLVVPYPKVDLLDISEALEKNIDNVTEMFRYAEDFFVETGLLEMVPDFWNKSMFEQPGNKTAVCHASAWDFMSVWDGTDGPQANGDYRIKMCTDKNQADFIVLHHEMGHTEYQMAYSERVNSSDPQPLIFRDGANPGFHEAIGDTIALSVSTPSHLQGLYDNITGSTDGGQRLNETTLEQRNINQLMRAALEKVAFIPYAYILDKFRWDVFAGNYTVEEYNYKWWDLRVKVQGLKPPVLRHKDTDFDPGCKFHVANGVPYIRYFVAHILQYQFHERLCDIIANDTGNVTEVFQCDIYGKKKAGEALLGLLQKGASQPWTEQLAEFMGSDGRMDSSSILAYFQPLDDFLTKEIDTLGITMEWDEDVDKYFVQPIPPTVPIIVGIVLCVMILIVVVAYFVGKKRQNKKNKKNKMAEAGKKTAAGASAGASAGTSAGAGAATGNSGGKTNTAFELGEKRASVSSSSSSSSSGSAAKGGSSEML